MEDDLQDLFGGFEEEKPKTQKKNLLVPQEEAPKKIAKRAYTPTELK